MTTLAERWMAEGEARGRAEGQRSMLIQLLTLKFGAMSERALARIGSGTEADLSRWTERVLSASSLDGLLDHDER